MSWVRRTGSTLSLDGRPFTFVGINVYQAASIDFDAALRAMPGVKVVRCWFYQHMANVGGKRDWTALDRAVAIAKAHGVRLVVALADQWGASTDGRTKFTPWWTGAYRVEAWNTGKDLYPYRHWVQEVTWRYRYEPTVMAVQLVNEGECRNSDGTHTEAQSATAIRGFADDVGALIRTVNANVLIGLGSIAGEAGTNEDDYRLVHNSPFIDLADWHDYGHPYEVVGNDDPWNGFSVSQMRAQVANCAFVVMETGIHYTQIPTTPTTAARAGLFKVKIDAMLARGVSGVGLWCFNPYASPTRDFEIGPGDPSLTLLR